MNSPIVMYQYANWSYLVRDKFPKGGFMQTYEMGELLVSKEATIIAKWKVKLKTPS